MKKIQKQTIKLRNQQQSLQNEYEDLISSRERQLSQNNHSKTDAIPQAQQDQQNIEQQIDQNRIRQTKSRSWHKRLDCRVNHSEMKEGRFSKQEVDCIMKVVNEYLLQNNLSNQDLQEYIELKSFGLSKIWLSIAKQIPNRSVDSIYKLIRRKYDSNNRHGYWSQNEEADLIKYVQQYGRKWREISKHFNRTPDNIRTKYTQIGEYNYLFRNKAQWTIGEFLILMKQTQNITQQMLLVSDYDSVLQTRFGSQFIETKFCLNFRKMNDFDRETFNILRSLVQIPNSFNSVMKWTEIAQEIKTKTKDDLRQMWYKLGFQ